MQCNGTDAEDDIEDYENASPLQVPATMNSVNEMAK